MIKCFYLNTSRSRLLKGSSWGYYSENLTLILFKLNYFKDDLMLDVLLCSLGFWPVKFSIRIFIETSCSGVCASKKKNKVCQHTWDYVTIILLLLLCFNFIFLFFARVFFVNPADYQTQKWQQIKTFICM